MIKHLHRLPIAPLQICQIWKIGAAISTVVLTGLVAQVWFDQQMYRQGERAYAAADCNLAIAQFNRILHQPRLFDWNRIVPRTQIKRAECAAFLQTIGEQNVEAALLGYENFVGRYSTSSLTRAIQQAAAQRFQQTAPADLAQPALCNELASFEVKQLIPQPDDRVPQLQYACGQTFAQNGEPSTAIRFYEQAIQNSPNHAVIQQVNAALASAKLAEARIDADRGDYSRAIRGYRQFLTRYPDHELTATAEAALVKVLVAEADNNAKQKNYDLAIRQYSDFLQDYPNHLRTSEVRAALAKTLIARAEITGTHKIPTPRASGSTLRGMTDIVIQNASPDKIRIVLSGPESRIEELPPCPTCKKYTGAGPTTCPTQGPVATYRLKPGQYEVLVETSDSSITPFKGHWKLADRTQYDSCFFVITHPDIWQSRSAASN